MPKFKIACTWEVCGEFEMEADTMEEAIDKAVEIEDKYGGIELPDESEYVDGSFFIDPEMSKYLNEEG